MAGAIVPLKKDWAVYTLHDPFFREHSPERSDEQTGKIFSEKDRNGGKRRNKENRPRFDLRMESP